MHIIGMSTEGRWDFRGMCVCFVCVVCCVLRFMDCAWNRVCFFFQCKIGVDFCSPF